jgi:23S rRNA pseudouridine2604 synthase
MKKLKDSNENKGIQINKYISNTGFCSRREAEKLIEQARVTINDELCLLSARINIGDVVEVDGEPLIKKTKPIYIAFNKPTGITTTTDLKDKTNIITFINHPKRIFPIGRLDKDSEGLILLTNDGDIVNKILRDGNNHEKEYIVTVDNPLTPEAIMGMSKGVKMMGTITKPCTIKQEGPKRFRIILTQGLNRQIRRMCAIYGYTVKSLKRVRIMHLHLDNLKTGTWRNLTAQEISLLEKQLSNSIK